MCAYTFDAGPNSFIIVEKKNTYMLMDFFNYIFFNEMEITFLDNKIETWNLNLSENVKNEFKILKPSSRNIFI